MDFWHPDFDAPIDQNGWAPLWPDDDLSAT
jgi:hypothetical protein